MPSGSRRCTRSVLPGQADEREMIAIVPVGAHHDEAPGQVSKSVLTRIVRPRIEEILTAIKDRMQATGHDGRLRAAVRADRRRAAN